MNDLYTEKFKKDTIKIILDNVEDLEAWSAWNDGKLSDDIQNIKALLNKIRGAI